MEPEKEEDELQEDELNQCLDWDSRNFGDLEFQPTGSKYKVSKYFLFFKLSDGK